MISQQWKYPLSLLFEVAEVKRKLAIGGKDFPQEASIINSSHFSDFGRSLGLPREKVGLKKRYAAYQGELCIQGANPKIALICPEKVCLTSRDFFMIKPNPEKILTTYLMILFRSGVLNDQIAQLATGKKNLLGVRGARNLKIPVPPLEVQKEMVEKWGYYAARELRLRKDLELCLEKFEYTVLESQEKLDQITEKMAKSAKSQAIWVKKSMLLKSEFLSPGYYTPAPLKIGKKETVLIEDIATIQGGLNVPGEGWEQDGTPVYGSGNVLKKYFSGEPLGFIINKGREKHIVSQNDILVCVIGEDPLGRAVVFPDGNDAFVNRSLVRLSGKKKDVEYDPYYLAAYFNTNHFNRQMGAFSRGSKQKYVGSDDLGKMKVILPDIEKQKELGEQFRQIVIQLQKIGARISPDKLSRVLVKKLLW